MGHWKNFTHLLIILTLFSTPINFWSFPISHRDQNTTSNFFFSLYMLRGSYLTPADYQSHLPFRMLFPMFWISQRITFCLRLKTKSIDSKFSDTWNTFSFLLLCPHLSEVHRYLSSNCRSQSTFDLLEPAVPQEEKFQLKEQSKTDTVGFPQKRKWKQQKIYFNIKSSKVIFPSQP